MNGKERNAITGKNKKSSLKNSSSLAEKSQALIETLYNTLINAEYSQLFFPIPVPHSDLLGLISYIESGFAREMQINSVEPESPDSIILHEIKNKIQNQSYISISKVEKEIEMQIVRNFVYDEKFPETTEKFIKSAKLIEVAMESSLIGDFDKFERELAIAKMKKSLRIKKAN